MSGFWLAELKIELFNSMKQQWRGEGRRNNGAGPTPTALGCEDTSQYCAYDLHTPYHQHNQPWTVKAMARLRALEGPAG